METIFGKNLKKLRKDAGLSQDKLAELVGITQATISSYENGGVYPRLRKYREKLVEVLNCSEAELFGYADGASSIEYGVVDLSENRKDINATDICSMPIYDTTALYPVDPSLKRKYPNGIVFKRYYNMCSNEIPTGAVLFSAPLPNIQEYDNSICTILIDNIVYVQKVKVVDEESVVLITDNKDKYEKKLISIADIEMLGKVI